MSLGSLTVREDSRDLIGRLHGLALLQSLPSLRGDGPILLLRLDFMVFDEPPLYDFHQLRFVHNPALEHHQLLFADQPACEQAMIAQLLEWLQNMKNDNWMVIVLPEDHLFDEFSDDDLV